LLLQSGFARPLVWLDIFKRYIDPGRNASS
jgi:hypothetical protein